jgi:site-specific DNA recombinase
VRDRIHSLKVSRNRAQAALERAKSVIRPTVEVGPNLVERFGHTMCEKLTTGDVPFRKAYLGSILDRVEVDDHAIRIVGRKDVLEQAVLAEGGSVPPVRSFVRKWRTGHDSNPRPPAS